MERLADFTLVALTNLPLEIATAELEFVGIAWRFAAVPSADQVLALKPRREAYEYAATALGDIRRRSWWDIAGALAAGCHAAFVRRPGMALIPFGDQPDIAGEDLVEVAGKITKSAGR